MYRIDDKAAAIFNVQRMLSDIARTDKRIPFIVPDGIFGDETRSAVSAFRALNGLSDGTDVDYVTFTAIVEVFRKTKRTTASPMPLNAFPAMLAGNGVSPGESSTIVYIVQAILVAMGSVWDGFESIDVNGVYDEATQKALNRVRKVYGIEGSDLIDRDVWDALCFDYTRCVDCM